jgi:hypothetical protein
VDATRTEPCRVCGGRSHFAFRQPLLGREVDYFDCPVCGYLQTESPTWLEKAYASAINILDTGILFRNRLNTGRVIMTLLSLGSLHGTVVDHAGGYGILVRLLRDAGVDARWRDKYCDNLLARGFEADDGRCDLMTAFEVLEHLVDPLLELKCMLEKAPTVLLSTELIPPGDAPPVDWWYLQPEHGQHIGFFRPLTLKWMARELGYHHASDGRSLHVFSKARVPWHWSLLQRAVAAAPLIARARLRSRTMLDFEHLRRVSRNP